MSSLVLDNIGLLVTNDPALGEGPLGTRRDVALVIEDGRVAAITSAGAAGDDRIDADGHCVIPGFVDSHTHLVFAGDRAEEFAARMAGAPYAAGGIRATVASTRAASDEQLRELAAARRREALRAGITHLEIKSGYALDVDGERRLCEVASELTEDVTFLGAHLLPPEYDHRADEYVALVCGEMLDACRPFARWIDVFCERGAFDGDQSRAGACRGPRRRARPARPRQPARSRAGRAGRGRDGGGVSRPLHAFVDGGRRRARVLEHGRHVASRHRLLDAAAVPGRAAPARRGRHGRARRRTATQGRATRRR